MKKFLIYMLCLIVWSTFVIIPSMIIEKYSNISVHTESFIIFLLGIIAFIISYQFGCLLLKVKKTNKKTEDVLNMWSKHDMYKFALKEHLIEPHILMDDISLKTLQQIIIKRVTI